MVKFFSNEGIATQHICLIHPSLVLGQRRQILPIYEGNINILILAELPVQTSMESQLHYEEKILTFTYDDYINRGKTLENLIIDKYVVYNKIGEGSNGQVYKGMDDRTKKQVAIKLMDLRSINAERSNAVRAIKQRLCESEPRLMYQFNSPNLMKCFDVFRNDDLKVLILEYCNGPTLQKQIDDKRRIPEKQAIEIIKHLINGLMELHKHKIIHRDLKAQNIMSHNGTYKIIDFGFSKKLQITQENAEVKGTSLGTITTMAPQVMSKRPYGLKADIWSLGVIYFQMIYGVYPYDSLTALSLYQEIKSKKLFEKPNPPTIGGFTPSKESYDFIKYVIVFQTSERPNWRQLSEYPLIKRQNDEVNQRFIQKVNVVVDPALEEWENKHTQSANSILEENEPQSKKGEEQKLQVGRAQKGERKGEREVTVIRSEQNARQQPKKQVGRKQESKSTFKINYAREERRRQQEALQRQRQEEYQRLQQEYKRLQKQKQEAERATAEIAKRQAQQPALNIVRGQKRQGPSNRVGVRGLKKEQVLYKRKQQNIEQKEEYQFTQRAHLECLKTQFIYREIINPLYTTKYLTENDRATVEFLYLLLARCFNNMSPIQDELDKRQKNKDMIRNLNDQITPLYNQVRSKFLEFSDKLTKTQSKVFSIVGDFFRKKIDKDNFSEKDNFLTGIEIINYSKEEQIAYTYKYYTSNIQKKIEGVSNLLNVVKRLNKYLQVNRITREVLQAQRKEFSVAVKDIVG